MNQIDLEELCNEAIIQFNKDHDFNVLIDFFKDPSLKIEDQFICFEKIKVLPELNQHKHPDFDKAVGIKHVKSWRGVWKKIRLNALATLFKEVEMLGTKKRKTYVT